MSQVMSEKELAAKLGLSYWLVRTMRLKEKAPHFTVGKRVLYRLETVLEWIASKEQSNQHTEPAQEYGKLRRID